MSFTSCFGVKYSSRVVSANSPKLRLYSCIRYTKVMYCMQGQQIRVR